MFGSPAATAILDAPWTLVFVAVCFMIHPLIGALNRRSATRVPARFVARLRELALRWARHYKQAAE